MHAIPHVIGNQDGGNLQTSRRVFIAEGRERCQTSSHGKRIKHVNSDNDADEVAVNMA